MYCFSLNHGRVPYCFMRSHKTKEDLANHIIATNNSGLRVYCNKFIGCRPLPYANAATERNKIVRIIKITGKSTFIFVLSSEAIVSRDKGNALHLLR